MAYYTEWNERIAKRDAGGGRYPGIYTYGMFPSGNQGGTYNLGRADASSPTGYSPSKSAAPTPASYEDVTKTTYAGTQPGYMGDVNAFELPDTPQMPIFTAPELEEPGQFVAPDKPIIEDFNQPLRDPDAITKKQSRAAAPGIRNLRETYGVVRAAARTNDPRGRQKLKDALSGYSKGLSEVISQSRAVAAAEYEKEYAFTYDTAVKNWTAQADNTRLEYEGDFKAAENNWQAAVQHVRDKYAGSMEVNKAQFQAEVDAVNMVYKAKVEAEKVRYEGSIKTMIANYDNAWKGFLASKITTTTRTYT